MDRIVMSAPPVDQWLLVDPSHRILHMFPAYNENRESLCGIPYVRGEYPDSYGTYAPFHGHPTKHCRECERKYQELED